MSCPADSFIVPAAALSNPSYINACTAVNITSNSAAQSALKTCCGSAPIEVIMDGCYSYCNVTSSADQQTFEKCFGSSPGVTSDVDYACTLDDNPLTAAGSIISAAPGSTYLGGSSGTLVFPSATDSSTAAASTTGTVTATAAPGQATATSGQAAANASNSASGIAKSSSSGKTSASATSSGATASSTANAGQPTVKQFSKGAVAILALALVGLLA
ncbi:hypothetical protein EYC80_000744 [Monilinia laxa]|uniref:Uncharacterized protein n=1 Tax=Monilinia laxa TaxID=61186 RepID=A0A5N6K713_MONLA|nr:hypothetical protein EYC80_000744 [Monilinia laxa]